MKKIIKLILSLSLGFALVNVQVSAEEITPIVVCHFELNEDGELVEVCEETVSPYELPWCTPECWGA